MELTRKTRKQPEKVSNLAFEEMLAARLQVPVGSADEYLDQLLAEQASKNLSGVEQLSLGEAPRALNPPDSFGSANRM